MTASANSPRSWKGNEEPNPQAACSIANAPNVVPVATDAFDMNVKVANRNVVPFNTVLPNDLIGEVVGANGLAHFPSR
jgi:hypothetical protein